MDRPGESNNELASTKGTWSVQFGIRKHPRIYEQENKSYIRNVHVQPSPEDDIVEMFMQEPSNPVPNSHRNDLVRQFFKNANLRHFHSDSHDACSQPDSLLDDRTPFGFGNIDEDGGLCRVQKGPLSPRQLFFELRKPRYTVTTSAAGIREVSRTDDTEPDAERRIIYIADPNPWSILAIVATASTNQSFAVRDFIYKYLNFQALFSVSIPTGATRFALEVHLPYYAWRKGARPNKDLRKDGSAHPLRKVRCVPFLHGDLYGNDHSSYCTEHIYQVQLSLLVSELDNRSWVGYCFVETYHDGEDSEDAVENYPSPASSPDDFRLDPASCGRFPASPPFWSPRVYFLQVLRHRIEVIKDEWANVVAMIQFRLEIYTHGIPLSRRLQQLSETSHRLEQLSRFYNRTHDTIRLLLDLKHTISKTINAWGSFCEFELGYLSNMHATTKDADSASSAILIIRRHFKEINSLADALKTQESLCNNIARELEQHLTLENNRTTWIQLETGENVKSITIIAVLVSPPSVAAAIFSMGSEVLPFNRNLGSYIITVIIVAVPIVILLWFLRRGSRRKIEKTFRNDMESSSIQPNRFQDHIDEESQSIRSSSLDESVEDGIELNNLSPTRSRGIL